MTPEVSARIDKWLWEVRIYKTRSMATEACKAGKVKMDGNAVKSSRELKAGDVLTVSMTPLLKTVRVKEFPKSRLSAKLVTDFMEDLTPQEEYERVKMIHETNAEFRDRGIGRPTKKHRRMIDRLKKSKDSW